MLLDWLPHCRTIGEISPPKNSDLTSSNFEGSETAAGREQVLFILGGTRRITQNAVDMCSVPFCWSPLIVFTRIETAKIHCKASHELPNHTLKDIPFDATIFSTNETLHNWVEWYFGFLFQGTVERSETANASVLVLWNGKMLTPNFDFLLFLTFFLSKQLNFQLFNCFNFAYNSVSNSASFVRGWCSDRNKPFIYLGEQSIYLGQSSPRTTTSMSRNEGRSFYWSFSADFKFPRHPFNWMGY